MTPLAALVSEAIGGILSRVVLAVLRYLDSRRDHRARILAELQAEGHERERRSLVYLAAALAHPTGGAELRTVPGAPDVPREPCPPDDATPGV